MNKIGQYFKEWEKRAFGTFKPNRLWFKNIGIGQRRWYLLLNNKLEPTAKELNTLANYFSCKVSDLYEFENL